MIFLVLIGVFSLPGLVFGQACSYRQNIASGQTIQVFSPDFPNTYTSGRSCSWQAVGAPGVKLYLTCNLVQIPCGYDSLRVSVTGSTNTTNDNVYCGGSPFYLTSKVNLMTLRLYTQTNRGRFNCTITGVNDSCQCGRRKTTRIVNGEETIVNEFPSMARLEEKPNGALLCGGTIIDQYYILTAAHCVIGRNVSRLQVKVGEHDTSTAAETPYTAIHNVVQLTPHQAYNSTTNRNDIALVRLATPLAYSEGVGPVCLPFRYINPTWSFAGDVVDATGWGSLSFGGPVSRTLQKVRLNVISNAQCQSTYNYLDSSQLCTYTPTKDSCQFDSGGPVYYTDPTGLLFNVGITSFGAGCGGSSPSGNTRVTSFLSWILQYAPSATFCNIPFPPAP